MHGRQHTPTRVLADCFYGSIFVQQLWVAILSHLSTSACCTNAVDKGLEVNSAQMCINSRVLQKKNGVSGRQHSSTRVLTHSIHTLRRLEQLWVAMDILASTSACCINTVAEGPGFGLSQNVHQFKGAPDDE